MADRRHPPVTSSRPTSGISVRRNLFNQHLSRRPTNNSANTSAETLRLDGEQEQNHMSQSQTSDIVMRDHNGEFKFGDLDLPAMEQDDDLEHGDFGEEESARERQRLSDAVKLHQRDRNRAPSEPAELLEAVKASLRAKVAALADDNWMYEAEDDPVVR